MVYEERFQEELQLEEWMSQRNRVILYGEKSLVVILLRKYLQMGLEDDVAGVSYEGAKAERKAFLQLLVKPIEAYVSDMSADIIVLGQREEHVERLCERIKTQEGRTVFVDYSLLAFMSQRDHVKLDFLCVGFTKCGTTSLHLALRKNKGIYLPRTKESRYIKWKNKYLDGPERLQKIYFSNDALGKLSGGIEPSYFSSAHIVYESFGADVKLIFMLRNPADATYSYFKMMMRRSYSPKQREYFRKYGRYSPEMFQDYLEDFIFSQKDLRFCYDIWLKEYLQFYEKERIMVIFFEEIINEPGRILKEVQQFIGVKPKKIVKLPYENQGKQVSKNYFCARVNAKLHLLEVKYKEQPFTWRKKTFFKVRDFIRRFTLVDNDEKISASDRDRLMAYYRPSVREVERLTGRSLKGLWYD